MQNHGAAAEELIACGVSQRVVHRLQTIQIDREDAGGMSVAPAALFFGREQLVPAAAVVEAGEGVGHRLSLSTLGAPHFVRCAQLRFQNGAEKRAEQLDERLLGLDRRWLRRRMNGAERSEEGAVGAVQ